MAVASPPPSAPSAPPAAPAKPAPPPPPPRVGETRDQGTVRRDSVSAERWTARGTAKVTGNVDVGSADLDGSVAIGGKLSADTVRSRGTLEVEGAFDVKGALVTAGALRTAGVFHAGDADLRGTVLTIGAAAVDRTLTVRGSLSAPSLTVGAVTLEGEAEVPGNLEGLYSVSGRFTDDSSLGTVKARSVVLRAKVPNLMDKVFFRRIHVTVRSVEADSVDLENVDAYFVRAPEIRLGRDAHITEYEGTIVERHPTARVGFESRSPPPYGLRR